MKTTFKTLICALVLGTTVAFAGPGSEAKKPTTFATGVYKNAEGGLTVNVVKNAPAFASVAIVQANGNVLVRESLSRKQTKIVLKFDVNALPDGEYTLEITSKGEKEVKPFTINSETSVAVRHLEFE